MIGTSFYHTCQVISNYLNSMIVEVATTMVLDDTTCRSNEYYYQASEWYSISTQKAGIYTRCIYIQQSASTSLSVLVDSDCL